MHPEMGAPTTGERAQPDSTEAMIEDIGGAVDDGHGPLELAMYQ